MGQSSDHIHRLVDHLFREESGKLNAILTRIFGFEHAELVEDIVQETFLTALRRWPHHSVPDNPPAWLMRVAKNKTLNALERKGRSIALDTQKESTLPVSTDAEPDLDRLFLDHEIRDSQLRVLLACCNPSLPVKAQIILTLKTLSGFSIKEISAGLLMKQGAVKKALYRARKSIRNEELALDIPFLAQVPERMDAVHTALYLMFNEGYKRTEGDELIKESLCYEAARLVRLLAETLPEGRPESYALLALFCFNSARFDSRLNEEGEIVDLKVQDRSLWDREMIRNGFYYLSKARQSDRLSSYHLEAGISSVHCAASAWEQTDWESILFYYDKLLEITSSPVVRINRAIALSNLKGPEAALEALTNMEVELPTDDYHFFHATKADLHFRMNNVELARSYYQVAMDLTDSKPEKRFLAKKMDRCTTGKINTN